MTSREPTNHVKDSYVYCKNRKKEECGYVSNASLPGDLTYVHSNEPHHIAQANQKCLTSNLDFTEDKSPMFRSLLKRMHYIPLQESLPRKIVSKKFNSFYKAKKNVCYCLDVNWLLYEMNTYIIWSSKMVISLLLRLQGWFTRYDSFLCLWEKQAIQHPYQIKEWQSQINVVLLENLIYTLH